MIATPSKLFKKKLINVTNELINSSIGTCQINLINKWKKPIKLFKGTTVAYLFDIGKSNINGIFNISGMKKKKQFLLLFSI